MTPSTVPPLWPDGDVVVRDDGYLILNENSEVLVHAVDSYDFTHSQTTSPDAVHRQPLLLYSSTQLLKTLYPSIEDLNEILRQPGYVDSERTKGASSNGNNNNNADRKEEDDDKGNNIILDSTKEAMDVSNSTESANGASKVDDDAMDGLTSALNEMKIKDNETSEDTSNTNGTESIEPTQSSSTPSPKKSSAKAASRIPPQYLGYQHLVKATNMTNRIQSALLDISMFRQKVAKKKKRNKKNGGGSRWESQKIEALEMQQKRLLKLQHQQQSMERKKDEDDKDNEEEEEGDNDDDIEGDDDDDDEEEEEEEDPFEVRRSASYITLRLIRTINSIRAVFPFLLPMLNHPRIYDKNLVIKDEKINTKKKRSAWLIGSQIFCATKKGVCANFQDDMSTILAVFVDPSFAEQILADWKGSNGLWNQWISQLQSRCSPSTVVEHPLKVLVRKAPVGINEQMILERARCLDEVINERQRVDIDCGPSLQNIYDRSVRNLIDRLSRVLKSRFPRAQINVYGSFLSNLSLGKGSDIDMSLYIPEADKIKSGFQDGSIPANKYEREMKRLVYNVYHRLDNQKDFQDMEAVARARIPVIKGKWKEARNPYKEDGSIDFDICFLNDIAVANSTLLGEYTKVDSRVRTFLIALKQFAKERKINDARNGCISSYAWVNLGIFYLQCIGLIPNLQSPDLMEEVGFVKDPSQYWHSLNGLDTAFVRWNAIRNVWKPPMEYKDTPVSILIYGFFDFYCVKFPVGIFAVSMKQGQIVVPKLSAVKVNSFLSIEDPFETYDSHTPHDLSRPADEKGSVKILEFMGEAYDYVEEVLCSEQLDLIGEMDIWPPSPYNEISKSKIQPTAKSSNPKTPTKNGSHRAANETPKGGGAKTPQRQQKTNPRGSNSKNKSRRNKEVTSPSQSKQLSNGAAESQGKAKTSLQNAMTATADKKNSTPQKKGSPEERQDSTPRSAGKAGRGGRGDNQGRGGGGGRGRGGRNRRRRQGGRGNGQKTQSQAPDG